MEESNHSNSKDRIHVSISKNTIPEMVQFLQNSDIKRVILVSDENEYRVLGGRVEEALQENGFDVTNVVLYGEEIGADEGSVVQALLPSTDANQMYIAVGSGTLTDVVRFVSFRAKTRFISLPTAPSVDGFASDGSSMTIKGFKQTVLSRPPLAIFADIDTLCEAPQELTASGFGDMFGKYTASADWQLAHLLVDEPYDEAIAKRSQAARDRVAEASYTLAEDREGSVHAVMEALIEEGLCMLDYGDSWPASGSEHHFSHYWEMKLLREKRPAIFHGAKVGVASIIITGYFQLLRDLSREEAAECLSRTGCPDPAEDKEAILRGYGPELAETVFGTQAFYHSMAEQGYEELKERILDSWDKVQEIADQVPGQDKLREMLKQVGGVCDHASLGLTDEDILGAMTHAHFFRRKFTVLKLGRMLGWTPEYLFESVV